MESVRAVNPATQGPVKVTNPGGASPYVLTCDHASNYLPARFGTLGLHADELTRHIAWDPGALPVASRLAAALDATLVESCISRLVIDCNRPPDAPDLVPPTSETTAIPGNTGLTGEQREARVAISWRPFHEAVESVIEDRLARAVETRLISIHSFTPVYHGATRPWHIGIIHDDDVRLAAPMIAALKRLDGVVVGVNEPYSPADRVYFTLERHARSRGLACAMIEIRNDEIANETDQNGWADRLAGILSGIRLPPGNVERAPPARSTSKDDGPALAGTS